MKKWNSLITHMECEKNNQFCKQGEISLHMHMFYIIIAREKEALKYESSLLQNVVVIH
jgi:hypothetical protein